MQNITVKERRTALDIVVSALRDYIIENRLQPGERLPPEHDLSASLGVSRNILREGMRFFRTLGIIESKPRIGAVIKDLHPKNPFDGYLPFMGRDERGFNEIMETRIALETGFAPLLVQRCTAEDINDLKAILKQFNKDREELRLADIAFHCRMLEIAGNRVLESLIPLTIEFFEQINRSSKPLASPVEDIVCQHQEIIKALESGESDCLVKALNKHYKSYQCHTMG